VAHAASLQAHEHLPGARLRDRQLSHLQRLTWRPEHRRAHGSAPGHH
jgi:hypothetical protein